MWTCDFEGCTKPAVRSQGECILCNQHICAQHLAPAFHKCPPWEVSIYQVISPEPQLTHLENETEYVPAMREAEREEIGLLIKKINLQALTDRASFLRNGIPCIIPALTYNRETCSRVMGGMNFHIHLRFSDGIIWLARIRRENSTSPPPQVRDEILSSEVATLNFLRTTKLPSPKVYDFALEGPGNPIGVSYMLQEKMAGQSCSWSLANSEQKVTLLSQLADVFIELSKHSFDSMGSLLLQPSLCIGPFAQESMIEVDSNSTTKTLGPFNSLQGYHTAQIRLILDLIRRREMYAQQPVDAYLIHLFLLEILPRVTGPVDSIMSRTPACFLKHPDDKGDHILVDNDFNITALIDWEWAYTAPPALAFNSPIMLFDVGDFYNGSNALSTDEETFAKFLEDKGRSDLAKYVQDGRIHHRFAFCCGYDLSDWDGFLGLFKGLRGSLGVDTDLDWMEWRAAALLRFQEDRGLQQVLRMQ